MKRGGHRALQVLMGLVSLAHLVMGVGLMLLGEDMVRSLSQVYGASIEVWSPQLLYLVKPLGAFMFALGLLAAAAARDPLRYRIAVYVFALLFVIRAAQRVAHQSEITETFGLEASRNFGNAAFFVVFAVVLLVLEHKARRSATDGPA